MTAPRQSPGPLYLMARRAAISLGLEVPGRAVVRATRRGRARLALALAPRIRVNGIGPGPTLPSPRQSAAEFRRQCAAMPLGRGTSPEEIAAAVRVILGAPAMTGQMIALDGGQHLGWAQPVGPPAWEE